jgi:hypothetical protein
MNMKCSALLALAGLLAGCAHSPQAKLNLFTPESTVIGFTKAAAAGDAKLAQSYFVPGGTDYKDISEILTAEPGAPRYPARVMLASVDIARPIIVKSQSQTENGLRVVWQVTFAKGFNIEGRTVEAGTEHDFDATLIKTENGWLIDNF